MGSDLSVVAPRLWGALPRLARGHQGVSNLEQVTLSCSPLTDTCAENGFYFSVAGTLNFLDTGSLQIMFPLFSSESIYLQTIICTEVCTRIEICYLRLLV